MHTTGGSQPATYACASWLFLRMLGIIYFAAFVSLATQIKGLAGRDGILPIGEFLSAHRDWQVKRLYRIPTLCWISSSDAFLVFLAWGGSVFALLLTIGICPGLMLVLLWSFYLSLFNACRLFLGYQWDVLLLETGFLAIFLAPLQQWQLFPVATNPPTLIVWLFWWLLFRLMFSSGFVKLRSRDPAWRRLTAVCHHYETQPLPTPVAWYAHKLPLSMHKVAALLMFTVELLVPFLILGPRPARLVASISFTILMLLIQLTGNYCFFNFLGISLSLLLLDDHAFQAVLDSCLPGMEFPQPRPPTSAFGFWAGTAVAVPLLLLSADSVLRLFRLEIAWPKTFVRFLAAAAPFHFAGSYGLFALMTTERPEIIVEGSYDGMNWEAYEFKWKPGDVTRAPKFVAPHQPRLDWQMWFAALGYCQNQPWFIRFLVRVLQGSRDVTSLLKTNPFPDRPPRFIRGSMYNYRFTDFSSRRLSGALWQREHRGVYCPAFELSDVPPGEILNAGL